MIPDKNILEQNIFLKNLFESIPWGIFIMDSKGRVIALNNVLEQAFGISGVEGIVISGGEAIGCIQAFKKGRCCGFA
ncbi:MAG: PAS domain-containing protein, partial [Syntrophales bacterium]